jgi:catechol 2,3-dioxygenase-like lactoylglutathione lyase family enzyme
MKIKHIAFVGIPVTDIKRSREFYEGVLGLKLTEEMGQGHWIEYAIGDQTLALGNFPDQWKPAEEGTSVALEVENFDETIRYLKDRQVPFDAEPFESPCCHMAVVQDPDGNKIIIHKLKPENEKEPCP